jgi:aromatic ring-opening dioxygenase catalytic subunit (LigB family)
LGPALLAKYQPKGILVFSAHWETNGEQLGTLRSPRLDHS